jgi:hypothetical protein
MRVLKLVDFIPENLPERLCPMRALVVCCAVAFSISVAPAVHAQGYINLLQDRSLTQWMKTDGSDVDKGWEFDGDGNLHLSRAGGNIVTRDEYRDFELWFDYRISSSGNNGIKYRVQKFDNSWLGLEYQIQDDAAFPKLPPKHYTASLYDIIDKSGSVLERKYAADGEFNTGRIVVQNSRLRHWMNGKLIIDELDCSQRFDEAIQKSKFKNTEGFGKNASGRLMLTDHNSEVWYRNLYIRRLDGCTNR